MGVANLAAYCVAGGYALHKAGVWSLVSGCWKCYVIVSRARDLQHRQRVYEYESLR